MLRSSSTYAFGSFALAAVLLSSSLSSQPQVSGHSVQSDLNARAAAQQAATTSGDPARVAESSPMLIASALRELAKLRLNNGEASEAVGMERQALELDDSNSGRLDLAQALAGAHLRDEAQQLVDQILAVAPQDLRALHLKTFLADGSRRRAVSHSETLAERTREGHLRRVLAVTYNDWGTAQAQQEDYRGALALFREGEHWDPTAPGLMSNMGMAAFRLKDFDSSVNAFTAALEADAARHNKVKDQQLEVLLGLSQFSLQHYAEAAKAFARSETVTYSDAHAAYAWAFSLAHLNQPQQAGAVLGRLIAMPLQPQERAMACQIYDQIEDYDHSVPCFQGVLAQDAGVPRVHFELGAALIHLNRPADALPELRAELAQGDTLPEVRYYLAYALNETQQKDEAERLLQTLVTEQADYTEAQYLLGKLLLEKGDAKQAISHLEQAARTTPDEPFVRYQLQAAYRRDGRIADADREMQIYRELKAKTRGEPTPR